MDYENRKSLLKDAYWFVEHDQIDTAISLVDEAFDNFMEFRAWWLTESNSEYRLFDEHFAKWVGKIMVMFYLDCPTNTDDTNSMIFLTYSEIYSE